MKRYFYLCAPFLLTLSACKHEEFLHYQPWRPQDVESKVANVREIRSGSGVDILWIIDNSASMDDYQQAIKDNTLTFMQNFTQSKLDWKMGLISTDYMDKPYVGFSNMQLLNSATAAPVAIFQDAVSRLGLDGDTTERPFLSLITQLKNYHDFSRPGVPLALMIVTDAEEQSQLDFQNSFYPDLNSLIGDPSKLFVYAVLNPQDFGCDGEDGDDWIYKGSPYEQLVNSAYLGKTFPLCSSDFGALLSSISKEIVQNVQHSVIYLDQRPKPETISVEYQGTKLPAGEAADGGVWTYDFGMNAIVFHDLSFSKNETDTVTVDYEVDDGFKNPRTGPQSAVRFVNSPLRRSR